MATSRGVAPPVRTRGGLHEVRSGFHRDPGRADLLLVDEATRLQDDLEERSSLPTHRDQGLDLVPDISISPARSAPTFCTASISRAPSSIARVASIRLSAVREAPRGKPVTDTTRTRVSANRSAEARTCTGFTQTAAKAGPDRLVAEPGDVGGDRVRPEERVIDERRDRRWGPAGCDIRRSARSSTARISTCDRTTDETSGSRTVAGREERMILRTGCTIHSGRSHPGRILEATLAAHTRFDRTDCPGHRGFPGGSVVRSRSLLPRGCRRPRHRRGASRRPRRGRRRASRIGRAGRNRARRSLPPSTALAYVDACRNHFGRLDILVNNAGIWEEAPIETLSPEHLARTLTLNLESVFHLCRYALPLLRNSPAGASSTSPPPLPCSASRAMPRMRRARRGWMRSPDPWRWSWDGTASP